MQRTLLIFVLAAITGGFHDADARGGGRGGGGMRGGGARTSVSRSGGGFSRPSGAGTARTANVNRSTANVNRDVNRNVNRNVNRDVNINGDRGYYRGGRYYGGAPVARAAAWGVAAGVTAAAIGSVAYSLPAGCATVYGYYNCGGVYYAPQYSGDNVTYVVVENPEGNE